jgi:Arginine deiminase
MENVLKIDVQSEIGDLKAVLLHTPGPEVENMTPQMAQRALYSDILNLSIAQKEYEQIEGVLSKVARVYQVRELLGKVLDRPIARESLITNICAAEQMPELYDTLMDMSTPELQKALIEGLPAKKNTLAAFLSEEYYSLYPLYNFYFTRDSSVTIGSHALICRMANKVRMRESLIMEAIYSSSGAFDCDIINYSDCRPADGSIFIEGGDILVARDDILLIGNGLRSSAKGIDLLASRLSKLHPEGRRHIIVQQLPDSPESFIHLDMVFTMLDKDKCMVYSPLILGNNHYQTIHITIENGRVAKINTVSNLVTALRRLGMDLETVSCGGNDQWNQEREQWHSGSNFFAIAPGKVLSYARNEATVEAMSQAGFEIIRAMDIVSGRKKLQDYGRCCITIDGSELPRGGGGARCMTMPLSREAVQW